MIDIPEKRPLNQRFRSLVIDKSAGLMNLVGKIGYADIYHPVGLRDHLRWFLEDPLTRIFNAAYDGSDEEIQAVYDGELPLLHMTPRQRALLDLPRDKYDARCVHCNWTGNLSACPLDLCPHCANAVYVDVEEQP